MLRPSALKSPARQQRLRRMQEQERRRRLAFFGILTQPAALERATPAMRESER